MLVALKSDPDDRQAARSVCVNRGGVTFRNFRIAAVQPQAFVVMQFNTREFDDLFNQVIDPVCTKAGLRAFEPIRPSLPAWWSPR